MAAAALFSRLLCGVLLHLDGGRIHGGTGRPGRPRAQDADHGLTSGEVAKQLGCSSQQRRPPSQDRAPSRAERPARVSTAINRPPSPRSRASSGARCTRMRSARRRSTRDFLAPGFKPTPEAIARIVVETREHPDTVLALWDKFTRGAPRRSGRGLERIAREYDEQIAAMDEDLARRRRACSSPAIPTTTRPRARDERPTRTSLIGEARSP